ncbi:MAG: LUD domain-containing protein [Bacillota bacterium]|nr:LUD domain-containing protein [Bacillota bacterium]
MTAPSSERVREALANQTLRGVLGRFADAFVVSRQEVFAGYDFPALRDQVAAIKDRAMARLPELADQFERAARSRGMIVFRAPDARSAVDYVVRLAREKGISRAVKSKSMASEEIDLNPALAAAGVHVVESDLGEWIIQQLGQRPSHMVMPALHLNRDQVASVFSRVLSRPVEPDIAAMVRAARGRLRDEFLSAQLGISGANAAVASTGTLVVLTNEGNGRLTTTLPPVHVAIVGYEKLIPTMADLVPILRILPRNATAQHLTSYVTMISGPSPSPAGPRELHVILLDNGRLELAQDGTFRILLRCLRCAACLNVCPVFALVGGHVFGGSAYTGGIGSLLTAFLPGGAASLALADRAQSLCTACGACLDYCACGLPIPELILELRRRLARTRPPAPSDRLAAAITAHPALLRAALGAARVASLPLQRQGTTLAGPLFREATSFRALPALRPPLASRLPDAVRSSRREEPQYSRHRGEPGEGPAERVKTVAFYSGCLVEHVYPEIGRAAMEVLSRAGFRVAYPRGQGCCGAPAIYTGQDATRAARYNIGRLLDSGADAVVTCCPTCAVALKLDFARILAGDSRWEEQARALADRTYEFTQFLASRDMLPAAPHPRHIAPATASRDTTGPALTVTYHDSCHLRYRLGGAQAPRRLLTSLPGYTFREMSHADRCCGFGGTYSFKQPAVSAALLGQKLDWVAQAGAEVVAVACPGCLLQLRGGLRRQGSTVRAAHIAELLLPP